jgi:hypothetical protein
MAVATTQDARKKMTMARAQENLYSLNVATKVCKVDSSSMGTIYNPYTSLPSVSGGTTTGPSYTVANYSVAADALQVNKRAQASEHVDSYDFKSVDFGLIRDRADNFGSAISNQIDRDVFSGVVGAGGFALGNNGVDGSATAWTSSNSVVDDIINAVVQIVDINEGHGKKKFVVVSPYEANDLRSYLQGTGNMVADSAITGGGFSRSNGYVGTTFSGVDVYMTNNLKNTVVLNLATNPTAGDTITINGVTFTFRATLTPAAGEVHIASTVDITRANLAELITGTTIPGDTSETEGADAGYVALSEANQYKFQRIGLTATNDNGANTLTITANSTLVVSETLTDDTDAWTTVKRYLVAGAYESIFLALPSQGMDYEEKAVSAKAGVEIYMEQFYAHTIWSRMQALVGTVLVD